MAVSAGMIAKAAATVLSNEKLRKGVGWTLVAILSPIIVLIALLCSIGSGGADHNNHAVSIYVSILDAYDESVAYLAGSIIDGLNA